MLAPKLSRARRLLLPPPATPPSRRHPPRRAARTKGCRPARPKSGACPPSDHPRRGEALPPSARRGVHALRGMALHAIADARPPTLPNRTRSFPLLSAFSPSRLLAFSPPYPPPAWLLAPAWPLPAPPCHPPVRRARGAGGEARRCMGGQAQGLQCRPHGRRPRRGTRTAACRGGTEQAAASAGRQGRRPRRRRPERTQRRSTAYRRASTDHAIAAAEAVDCPWLARAQQWLRGGGGGDGLCRPPPCRVADRLQLCLCHDCAARGGAPRASGGMTPAAAQPASGGGPPARALLPRRHHRRLTAAAPPARGATTAAPPPAAPPPAAPPPAAPPPAAPPAERLSWRTRHPHRRVWRPLPSLLPHCPRAALPCRTHRRRPRLFTRGSFIALTSPRPKRPGFEWAGGYDERIAFLLGAGFAAVDGRLGEARGAFDDAGRRKKE